MVPALSGWAREGPCDKGDAGSLPLAPSWKGVRGAGVERGSLRCSWVSRLRGAGSREDQCTDSLPWEPAQWNKHSALGSRFGLLSQRPGCYL